MKMLRPFLAVVFWFAYMPGSFCQPLGDPLLDSLLPSLPRVARWKVIYSRVDRDEKGRPSLTNFVASSPGSDTFSSTMVHLPLAAWVLEKFGKERKDAMDLNSIMISEADYGDQTPAYNDPRWPDGKPTLGRYLRNMLLLRDIPSFNRLYEYAGQEYLLKTASARGLDIRYCKRPGDRDEDNARHTNPVSFYDPSPRLIMAYPSVYNGNKYPKFASEATPVHANILRPESLHAFLISLALPAYMPSETGSLSAEDRRWLLRYASQWPEETVYPLFGREESPNAFFESFCPEDSAVRVFSTGGEWGTQLIESAYIIDTARHAEFLLTVAADAGQEKSLEQAYSLMEYCGSRLLEAERRRSKAHFPDLSGFIFSYDK